MAKDLTVLDHSGMTLWPVVLDTQVLWSLHIEHYCYILLPSFDPIVHYE